MRRFNPEKELRKIQHGGRNRVIAFAFLLLVIGAIGYSHALYQIRYSKRIIYTRVKINSSKSQDIVVKATLNGSTSDFPVPDGNHWYSSSSCNNSASIKVDENSFETFITPSGGDTNGTTTCTVNFIGMNKPNAPVLYNGLVPITIEENSSDPTQPIIKVASSSSSTWYNYEEHKWANAVLMKNDTVAKDFSGNGNHGEIVGGATISADGLELDGSDDGIFIGNSIRDLFATSNTIQVKFKRPKVGVQDTVIGNYNTTNYVRYDLTTGNLSRIYYNSSKATGSGKTKITADLTTVTYVFDKENGKISVYYNGDLDYELTNTNITNLTPDFINVYVGRDVSTGTGSMAGTIEKVMVYDDILTLDEIKKNASVTTAGTVGGSGVVSDHLKLYYDFKASQTISATSGTKLNMNAIRQMYVWIPRYRYKLNASSRNNIIFETGTPAKSTGTTKGEWLTHPAFTFGDTELPGFWVGKFETSGTETDLTIKPNIKSFTGKTMSVFFKAARDIDLTYASNYNLTSSQIDTHMMKNMEWGAVVYLTNSIYGRYTLGRRCISGGCEVWDNPVSTVASGNAGATITGCAGDTIGANTQYSKKECTAGYTWSEGGVNASTTGNMTGIYDMSAGAAEAVMGNMVNASGEFQPGSAGTFSPTNPPEAKYYDSYAYNTLTNPDDLDEEIGHLGDATKELYYSSSIGSTRYHATLYGDKATYPYKTVPWFKRGATCRTSSTSDWLAYYENGYKGIFAFEAYNGAANAETSFRVVLSAQ